MRILVVDDEARLRNVVAQILAGEGFEVATASDGRAALDALRETPADVIMCDVRMPEMDGFAFLEEYRRGGGQGLVIVMTAYGDDDTAIDAMKRGAYDFIPKPFRSDQVILVVRKALERERLRRQVEQLSAELTELRPHDEVVGHSQALRDVLKVARKVARHPTTVLITGESGTGKELIARLVHSASPRSQTPFVAVNCGAIPEALLESELFGHAKGAFTGAASDRRGLFEEADGGTIFLDEIGELAPALQVKLLRALQESEIRPVGDNTARKVDVRVIAATARDLAVEVNRGLFRADLYYRLNIVHLHLPPLRERREDIADLAKHFLELHNARLGTRIAGFAPDAMRAMLDYDWPGNVRELENAVERSMVLADGDRIAREHLPHGITKPSPMTAAAAAEADALSVKKRTEALERVLIQQALQRTGGNRTRAAELLELSHRALLYKIREYGLADDAPVGFSGGRRPPPDRPES